MKKMKALQNLSYSQGVSLICLGFAASVTLAVVIKMIHQIFLEVGRVVVMNSQKRIVNKK